MLKENNSVLVSISWLFEIGFLLSSSLGLVLARQVVLIFRDNIIPN